MLAQIAEVGDDRVEVRRISFAPNMPLGVVPARGSRKFLLIRCHKRLANHDERRAPQGARDPQCGAT